MATLSGCAFAPGIWNPAALPDTRLAHVVGRDRYADFAQVQAVYDSAGKRVIGTNSYVEQDRWKEVFLPAGTYRFVVFCYSVDPYPPSSAVSDVSN